MIYGIFLQAQPNSSMSFYIMMGLMIVIFYFFMIRPQQKKAKDLIYGGGRVGLMGVLADAVLDAGGRVQGGIPQALAEREVAHLGRTRRHVVDTMQRSEPAVRTSLVSLRVSTPSIATMPRLASQPESDSVAR